MSYCITDYNISPNGKFVIICTESSGIYIVEISTQHVVGVFRSNITEIYHCNFSDDGKMIYLGDDGGKDELWSLDISTNTLRLLSTFNVFDRKNLEDSRIASSFSPNGLFLATQTYHNPDTYLYSTQTYELIKVFHSYEDVSGWMLIREIFSPDSSNFIYPYDNAIKIWSIITGKFIRVLKPRINIRNSKVNCCKYSKDGRYIVACYTNGGVSMWNADSGIHVRDFTAYDRSYRDTKHLSIVTYERETIGFKMPRTKTGKVRRPGSSAKPVKSKNRRLRYRDVVSINGEIINCFLSPNNTTLICLGSNNEISLWCVRSGQCLNKVKVETNNDDEYSFCLFVGSEPTYIVSTLKSTRLISLRTGKCIQDMTDINILTGIMWRFSNDGKMSVTLGYQDNGYEVIALNFNAVDQQPVIWLGEIFNDLMTVEQSNIEDLADSLSGCYKSNLSHTEMVDLIDCL